MTTPPLKQREDVGTEPRKPLTATQRLKIFEDKKGICCTCGMKIHGKFIDEHWRALGLGGSNHKSNRDIAHIECAAVKTGEQDMPRINKAKRQKKAQHGLKPEGANKIESAGFKKYEKAPRNGAVRIDKSCLPPLPRRNPLTGEIIK